jgi:hypothetical protein
MGVCVLKDARKQPSGTKDSATGECNRRWNPAITRPLPRGSHTLHSG